MLKICQYKEHLPVCYEEMDCPACETIAKRDQEIKDLEDNVDDLIRQKENLLETIDDLEHQVDGLENDIDDMKEQLNSK
jgi:predicted  nucleic acid-binding Zn-ribbon protein